MAETTEITLQNNVLLPLAVQVFGAVAHLTPVQPTAIGLTDEHSIIGAAMLDDAGTFQQSGLFFFTLEIVAQATLDNSFQIGCQLAHLARSKENVRRAVVIEEQGGIVEMAHTCMDGPWSLGFRCGKYIGVAHSALFIRGQQCPELTVVKFQ